MELKQTLASAVHKWNLLANPFYQAWSAGTLSIAGLQTYASEYGNFIALLPLAWQTLGDLETADEERTHDELWQQFAESIHAPRKPADLAESKALIEVAGTLFAQPVTAMGALYAFEVQQPETASSKLSGLKTHYHRLGANETYFEEHTHNQHEAEKLLKMMSNLSEKDQQSALTACETMSRSLWDTLSAIGDSTPSD